MRHHVNIDTRGLRIAALALMALIAASLAACGTPPHRAPVESRTPAPRPSIAAAGPAAPASSAETGLVEPKPTGTENAGKPGYYTVKPGDTLIRIGLDNGQSWRDIVKWNALDNPNLIEVGQVLRVVAPGTDPSIATTRPVTTARVDTRPLDSAPATPPVRAASASGNAPAPVAAVVPPAAVVVPPAPTAAREGDDDVAWSWPVNGVTPAPYNEAVAKALLFNGKAGDAVLAAADGRVVYAGSDLRGYGNLVIVKHNATYLTAYAHNQTLLVKEDQQVKRGQKIAEMGSTDAEHVQLRFEIRKQGKPVDPSRLLPSR